MSSDKKRVQKQQRKKKERVSRLKQDQERQSDMFIDDSEFDIMSEEEQKQNQKRKKSKTSCRKLWTQIEDEAIEKLVQTYGIKKWTFLALKLKEEFKINGRTGKQCRERWHNHLDPEIKKDPISPSEEKIIFDQHKKFGNKWAEIAKFLQGRSDNCIKNYYYSTLRKHLRRINKSLKVCQVAKKLNLKVKNMTAEYLYTQVKDQKISYEQIKEIDSKRFQDLEYIMKLIFNHNEEEYKVQQQPVQKVEEIIEIEEKLQDKLNKRRSIRLNKKKRINYAEQISSLDNLQLLIQVMKSENSQKNTKPNTQLTNNQHKSPIKKTSKRGRQRSSKKSKQFVYEQNIYQEQGNEMTDDKNQYMIQPQYYNKYIQEENHFYNHIQTPQNNFNIHIDSTTPQQIIFQFPESRGLTSPLYLPISSKGFQFLKESPRIIQQSNNYQQNVYYNFGRQRQESEEDIMKDQMEEEKRNNRKSFQNLIKDSVETPQINLDQIQNDKIIQPISPHEAVTNSLFNNITITPSNIMIGCNFVNNNNYLNFIKQTPSNFINKDKGNIVTPIAQSPQNKNFFNVYSQDKQKNNQKNPVFQSPVNKYEEYHGMLKISPNSGFSVYKKMKNDEKI